MSEAVPERSSTQQSAQRSAHRDGNWIRPSKRRAVEPVSETVSAQASKASPTVTSAAKAPTNRSKETDPETVPAAVAQRFVQMGRKYYFPDGARAFTDRGDRLTTPSENTEVIRSLISIAQARGWDQITVRGTERFRKEAWMAAKLSGLDVKGYRPTQFEQAYLIRTAVTASLQRESAPAWVAQRSQEAAEDRNTPDERRTVPTGRVRNAYAERHEMLLRGILVDHGAAPYRHQHGAERNYFVMLETERGPRTVWGVDLERALRESLTQPTPGDEVGVRTVRREPVTIKSKQRDAQGKVVSEQSQTAHRNHWILEKQQFFEERARAASMVRDASKDARQGVKQHPELAGTYIYLQGAKELANKRIRDSEDRKRFVATVRTALADSIARGEALPPVRLRTKAAAPTTRHERPAMGRE